jgi:hypothetical protein
MVEHPMAALDSAAVDLDRLIPGVIGAFVGVVGWLFVGMYIQRRQFGRQARNAARAVYFELDVNRVGVLVARDTGSFTPLDRSSFDRLLPELATLIPPKELKVIVSAYMAHAGYRQASLAGEGLPREVRAHALNGILEVHERALDALRSHAFSRKEASALAEIDHEPNSSPATVVATHRQRGADRGG